METLSGLPSLINSYLPEPQASLLNGILLGLPLSDTGTFYDELRTVGLVHLVVLSGSNITILINMMLINAPIIGRRQASIVSIIAITAFILFVGIQPPVLRAGLCGVCCLLGFISGRKVHTMYILIVSVVVILVFYPEWVSSLSFYLSYAATVGIVLVSRPTEEIDGNISTLETIWNYLKTELRTTLAAQLFTAPLIWWHFRQISLIAPLANIVVSWAIAPLMIAGITTLILGSIERHLGIIPAGIAYGLLRYIVEIVHFLARIPGATIYL